MLETEKPRNGNTGMQKQTRGAGVELGQVPVTILGMKLRVNENMQIETSRNEQLSGRGGRLRPPSVPAF